MSILQLENRYLGVNESMTENSQLSYNLGIGGNLESKRSSLPFIKIYS